MNTIPSFYIRTLGCKVNRAESETIASQLLARGWSQAQTARADVAILNTCTVTAEADAKNRKALRALLKHDPEHVIVTGCAMHGDATFYEELDRRIVCTRDKNRIPELACQLFAPSACEMLPHDAADIASLEQPMRIGNSFRTRVDMKIQDGCDNACTYCIVRKARGPARSVPAAELLTELSFHVSHGVQEVVLVGIDLGAYRSDGLDLAGLVNRILSETDIGRIRISSLEPQSLTPPLIGLFAQSQGRLCRHVHLCLQSGSDNVLRAMNRHYSAAEFLALAEELRARVPGIALSTDIIVGFPGESDEDFEATCQLVRSCSFMRLHVFRYSKRPGTPAAARTDHIDAPVIAQRATHMREIGRELAREDALRRLGTQERVIVERAHVATSESYHTINFAQNIEQGTLLDMVLCDYDEQADVIQAKPV